MNLRNNGGEASPSLRWLSLGFNY